MSTRLFKQVNRLSVYMITLSYFKEMLNKFLTGKIKNRFLCIITPT